MSKDKPKGGLGKGLDVLFGANTMDIGQETASNVTELNPKAEESVLFISLDQILSNPYQPRQGFDEAEMKELAESIKQKGVIQAITVRKLEDGNFELISGERRLRASKIAGLEKIPAFVMDVSGKEDLLEIALIENIQRKDLNAIEIAEGYQRLIDECRLTQEQVSEKVGKSRSTVTNFLRMLKLPDQIKQSIRKGELSEGHSRSILSLESEVDQLLLWKKIIGENLSVRKAEELTKKLKKQPKSKKFYEITDQNKAAVNFLEEKFREHFGTKVKLHPTSPTSGNIIIEYYTAEDLERIIDLCKK
jgi:ParB family chromosome partitioning protein